LKHQAGKKQAFALKFF